MRRVLPLALLFAAGPAWAQRTELTVLGGYSTAGDIDKKAPQFQELAIDAGFTWGVAAGHFFTPHIGVEASWVRQESGLKFAASAGSETLFDVSVDQVQGAFAYRFGSDGARMRPFLSAGLGATFFSATDLESETKLAWSVGGGLQWSFSRRLGARAQVRYRPTYLNDTSSDFCDPFGFCQGWLHQFEYMGGVTLRF